MKGRNEKLPYEFTNQGLTTMRCNFCGGNLIIHLPAKVEGNPEIRCLQCGRCADLRKNSEARRIVFKL